MTHTIGKCFPPVASAVKYGFPRWDVTVQDGDTLKSIARVLPVGSNAERQANADRLALCWNTHDELLEALEKLADNVHAGLCWEHDYGQPPSSLDALIDARAAIKAAKE